MKKVGSFDVNLVGTHGNIKILKISKPLRLTHPPTHPPPLLAPKEKKTGPLGYCGLVSFDVLNY
jgi:hypothetical protein